MKTATQRTIGDRAFEVEWCTEIPMTEFGDCDIDNAVYKRRFVNTIEEALTVAREVYPQSKSGVVSVTPVEWIDPYGDNIRQTFRWDYCGDSRHYSNDEQPGTDGFDD